MSISLSPGEVIPGTRYRVQKMVAEGAMGAVYSAEHVDLEKPVAIKTLLAELASSPEAIERMRREARAASKIGSPFICDVTDFGTLPDGQVFFVMEYLPGKSLAEILHEEGPMGPARAIGILRQVAKALGAAHNAGIVHLDVKPDNIMLLETQRRRDGVKVVDFGVAGLVDEGASEDKIAGTPEYIAPERAEGLGYDGRTDIYALGVMAYEMLTGGVPFTGDGLIAILKKQIVEVPTPMAKRAPEVHVPPALESLVMQMLAKDPAQRPQRMEVVEAMLCEAQIASDLRTEWDQLDLPEVDEAWQQKLAERMPGRGKQKRGVVLAAVLAAAIAAGFALYFGLYGKEVIKYVRVAATDTEEAERVAHWLEQAERAGRQQRYVEPETSSALFFLQKAESEAEALGRKSAGAATLRGAFASALTVTGNELLKAGLDELAIEKFNEALFFAPGDKELQDKARLSVAEKQEIQRAPGTRRKKTVGADAQANAGAISLFEAARKGRHSEARAAAKRLLALDKEGVVTARMADAIRKLANRAWDNNAMAQARPLYQLVLSLDGADLQSQERARAEAPAPVAATAPVREEDPPAEKDKDQKEDRDDKRRKQRKTAQQATEESDAPIPRDEAAAALALKRGRNSLREGQLAAAESAFNEAVRADPLNGDAVMGLAEVQFERASYSNALDYARRAVRLGPNQWRPHMVLGDAYFKLLRYEEALASYGKARTLSGGNKEINVRLTRLEAKFKK